MRLPLLTFSIAVCGMIGINSIATADDYSDKYSAISEHNIFLKDRPRPRPVTTRNTDRNRNNDQVEESPDARIVLRGVVIEDDELRAYFENTRGNSILKVVPGDRIGKGHVMEIAIDAVRYELDGKTDWIEIGHNLLGAKVNASNSGSSRPMNTQQPRINPAPQINTPAPTVMQPPEQPQEPVVTVNENGEEVVVQPPTNAVDPSTLSVEERLKLRRQTERTGGAR